MDKFAEVFEILEKFFNNFLEFFAAVYGYIQDLVG